MGITSWGIGRLGIVYNQLEESISSEELKQNTNMRPMQYSMQRCQVQQDADQQDQFDESGRVLGWNFSFKGVVYIYTYPQP